MKRILFLLVACALITNVNAQQFYTPLAADNSIQLYEPLKTNKKPYNALHMQNTQRNVIWSESFSNGIPNTWSFNGYYTNSNGVQVSFPDQTQNPPLYGWEYRGPNTTPNFNQGSIGLYTTNLTITSPTASDGFIIFDSDFLDNGNTAIGAGPAPTPHVGCLTTDIIDCSNYPDLQLKMNTYHRSFFGQTFIAFSTDGGQTWPDTLEIHALEVNESTDTNNVELVNVSAYIGGAPNAQMQFIFEGATDGNANGTGYYFWQMDDIELSELPSYDLRLYTNDFRYDNNDIINSYYGIELRDYVGQIPLNQLDSISFGFGCLNFGSVDQTFNTEIVVNDASGTNVYTNTEYFAYALPSNQDTFLYQSNKFIPSATSQYTISYSINSDTTDSSPFDNELFKSFIVSDTVFSPFNPLSNDLDIIGTGFFDGGDDGFKMANLISLIEADELSSVTVGLNTSTNDQYNTVAGGGVIVTIFDTVGFYSASVENPIISSNFYLITQDDVDNNSATIPIPVIINGNTQDRSLNPGSYYVCIEMYNSGGINEIRIRDDESTLRYPWESIIYIPGEQWYTNGNAFDISANFGTWISNVEESVKYNTLVYPNPSNGMVQISYTLNAKTNTSIYVKDLSGKIVFENQYGNQNPGIYSEKIDLSRLSNGVYLYEISTENHLSQGKIVLTK